MPQPPMSANAISSNADRPITPFILSLLGGLFIIVGGVFGLVFFNFTYYYGSNLPYVAVAVTTGIVVLAGAFMLYVRPDQHVIWGVIIVVFLLLAPRGIVIGIQEVIRRRRAQGEAAVA